MLLPLGNVQPRAGGNLPCHPVQPLSGSSGACPPLAVAAAATAAKSLQLCPTLCDPIDSSPGWLRHPGDSPGKNTGVGCHFLLQCMKVKSDSEVAQSCPTLCDPMDCSPPGSSVHGIYNLINLEGVLGKSLKESLTWKREMLNQWAKCDLSHSLVKNTQGITHLPSACACLQKNFLLPPCHPIFKKKSHLPHKSFYSLDTILTPGGGARRNWPGTLHPQNLPRRHQPFDISKVGSVAAHSLYPLDCPVSHV